MEVTDIIRENLKRDKKRLAFFKHWADMKADRRLKAYTSKGRGRTSYYFVDGEGKQKYVSAKEKEKLFKIQMIRLGKKMTEILESNISDQEKFLDKYQSSRIDKVAASLPKAYRLSQDMLMNLEGGVKCVGKEKYLPSQNPYRKEDLTIATTFGLSVRSKAEALVADILWSMELDFKYEAPLTLTYSWKDGGRETVKKTVMYPDFTVSNSEGEVFYIEVKGMLYNPEYANRDSEKMCAYSQNGIYEPHNLITISGGGNNEMDMLRIQRVLETLLG